MPSKFKPMLAAPMDADEGQTIQTLRYPLLATPKVDGIRCIIINGVAMSRTLKPIPNAFIQSIIGTRDLNGLDGELLVGDTFQQVTSGIMSEDGRPDFTFHVFDVTNLPPGTPYEERVEVLRDFSLPEDSRVRMLLPVKIHNAAELAAYNESQLALGFEGVMVRDPNGPYKNGRATWKEGYLTKVKPFEDAEAEIVGFEEQMHNGNAAEKDAFGRTKRSSHKENLMPKGTLGALVCRCNKFSETFNIGTGFNDVLKLEIWNNQPAWLGASVKFKYQAIGSTKEKPRIPVFLGRRDPRD